MKTWIGIDIGRRSISLSAVDELGTQIRSQEVAINLKPRELSQSNFSELLAQIAAQIDSITSAETETPQALGISCANRYLLGWDRNSLVPVCSPVEVLAKSSRCSPDDKPTQLLSYPNTSQSEAELQRLIQTINENDSLIFGTLECWLLSQLTGSNLAFIDPSCASRFFSLDQIDQISKGIVPEDLGLNLNQLPTILPSINSSNMPGIIRLNGRKELVVSSLLSRQSALLIANRCFLPGQGVLLLGRESKILINLGTEVHDTGNALVAWQLPNGEFTYYIEIEIPGLGDTLQWLFSNFGLGSSLIELHQLAKQVRTSEQVTLVPYRAKSDSAKTTNTSFLLAGLGVSSNRFHIARAGLESIALQVSSAATLWNDSNPVQLQSLSICNVTEPLELLFQLISDLTNMTIVYSRLPRTPSYGAALSALPSLGTGSIDSNDKTIETDNYIPSTNSRATAAKLDKWSRFQNKLAIFDQ